jgi:transcriptional regulator GlxA family with amidase domain
MTRSEEFTPKTTPARSRRHRVAVLAFDGVVLGDLATPCEIFGRTQDGNGTSLYEIRVCGLQPMVESEHLMLKVPWRLSSLRWADTIIVPGLENLDGSLSERIFQELRRAASRAVRVASICSGAFVLARSGLLDGLRATTHWLAAGELARRFPAIDVNPDVLYIDNGNVLTSAGAAAGLDLCLYLIRRDFGAEVASHAARAAVMPLERAGGQAQFIIHQQPVTVDHPSIGSLLVWIEQNLRMELVLPVIAQQAAMSTRTLSRRFREQVGTTPARWIADIRVRHGQRLLETTDLSVEEIAAEVGFKSASVMRVQFRRTVGTSPITYRGAFGRGRHRLNYDPASRCVPSKLPLRR